MVNVTLDRVFVLGGMRIKDQAPDLPLANAVRVLAKTYPQFRHTRVFEEDGQVQGDELVYTLKLPPNKSNG